jgi:hypothetical protein
MTIIDNPVGWSAPPTPDEPRVPCPVPGCTFTTAHTNALGPHIAMHRRKGDPGVPAPKYKSKAKRGVKGTAAAAPPRPKKAPPKLIAADFADGIIAVLYPNGVPRDQIRDVAAWIEQTDRLAAVAIAAAEAEADPTL